MSHDTASIWAYQVSNPVFLCLLAIVMILFAFVSVFVRRLAEEKRRRIILAVCVFTMILFTWYKLTLSADPEYNLQRAYMGGFTWWNEMPLHLCNINMILIPLAVLTKNRALTSFCFFVGSLGAALAILIPGIGFADMPIWLPRNIGYIGTHLLIVLTSLSLVTFGLFRPRMKDYPLTAGLLFGIALLAHGFNMAVRLTGLFDRANYFYTVETEGNPALELFHNLIPVPFWYLLPAIPILFVYMSVIILIIRIFEKPSKDAADNAKQ
ncbi:MAG: YwaF family protein [Solobacterium sp.]|nr:YwaF family protein [Solobacterium sp.]